MTGWRRFPGLVEVVTNSFVKYFSQNISVYVKTLRIHVGYDCIIQQDNEPKHVQVHTRMSNFEAPVK